MKNETKEMLKLQVNDFPEIYETVLKTQLFNHNPIIEISVTFHAYHKDVYKDIGKVTHKLANYGIFPQRMKDNNNHFIYKFNNE